MQSSSRGRRTGTLIRASASTAWQRWSQAYLDGFSPNGQDILENFEFRNQIPRLSKVLAFDYAGMHFEEGLRVDLLVEGCLVVELKSVENLAPVHAKQVLTYLRLMNLSLGLLIKFGAATFKEGVKRVVNGHANFASSRLRVQQEGLTRSPEGPKQDR